MNKNQCIICKTLLTGMFCFGSPECEGIVYGIDKYAKTVNYFGASFRLNGILFAFKTDLIYTEIYSYEEKNYFKIKISYLDKINSIEDIKNIMLKIIKLQTFS